MHFLIKTTSFHFVLYFFLCYQSFVEPRNFCLLVKLPPILPIDFFRYRRSLPTTRKILVAPLNNIDETIYMKFPVHCFYFIFLLNEFNLYKITGYVFLYVLFSTIVASLILMIWIILCVCVSKWKVIITVLSLLFESIHYPEKIDYKAFFFYFFCNH